MPNNNCHSPKARHDIIPVGYLRPFPHESTRCFESTRYNHKREVA